MSNLFFIKQDKCLILEKKKGFCDGDEMKDDNDGRERMEGIDCL